MSFITVAGNVTSYADALDVRGADQRLFEANTVDFTNVPGAPADLDEYIEDLTTASTDRINQKIKASARWREYLGYVGTGYNTIDNIPAFNPNLILSRQADFTQMCISYTLKEYLLPKVADFGNPESPEVQKIQFHENRFNELFSELTDIFDYYDSDSSGTVDDDEKMVRFSVTRRSRGARPITRIR